MLFLQIQCILRLFPPLSCGAALSSVLLQATRRGAVGSAGRDIQPSVDDELLPKVALVGRPNVGKSALFNRLLRRRAALVYNTPDSHVTRDYQEGRAQLGDLVFRVADTSGLEPRGGSARSSINARATAITGALLRQCHLTLLVLDAKHGVLPADEEVAAWLRRHVPHRDQVLVVANKAEGARAREEMPQTVYDCYRLGFGEPVALSATTGEGMADLYVALQPHIDKLTQQLKDAAAAAAEPPAPAAAGSGLQAQAEPGTASAAALGVSTTADDAGRQEQEEGEVEREEGSPRARLSHRRRRLLRRSLFGGSRVGAAQRAGGEEVAAAEGGDAADASADAAGDAGGGGSGGGGGVLKLGIMGLPNAGKSTLLNRLLGQERALTGPEPGLTRDAVRAAWMYGSQPVELIDTAGWIGLGRTASYDDVGGEVASMSRDATLRSLAQVHVAVLVVDVERALQSNRVLARRELSLAAHVIREGKALVLVANKIDVLTPQQRALYGKALRRHLSERFLEAGQLTVVEVSAREGAGLEGLMPVVTSAYQAWNKRVGTARLNNLIAKLSARMAGGATEAFLGRIRYLTQIKSRPPTFVAFLRGSRTQPVSSAFSAFLAAQIREVLGFPGVPLRIWFRYRDRAGERKLRLVATRSRRGNDAPAAAGGAAATAAAGGYADFDAADVGPGSIMADALRRAEELRREDDERDGEDVEHFAEGPAAVPALSASWKVPAAAMAEVEVDAAASGRGSSFSSRYMPPAIRRRRAAAAAQARGGGGGGDLACEEGKGEEAGRGGDGAPGMELGTHGSRSAAVPAREAPPETSAELLLHDATTGRNAVSSRSSGSGGGGSSSRGSSSRSAARLQKLDDDDDAGGEGEGEGGWRWDDGPSPPRRQSQAPGQAQAATDAAAACAADSAAAMAHRRTHGSKKGGGGAAPVSPSRTELLRAALLSRKPSAPLVPVQAPPRSRKQRGAASSSGGK